MHEAIDKTGTRTIIFFKISRRLYKLMGKSFFSMIGFYETLIEFAINGCEIFVEIQIKLNFLAYKVQFIEPWLKNGRKTTDLQKKQLLRHYEYLSPFGEFV